jgi:hypothetical protein
MHYRPRAFRTGLLLSGGTSLGLIGAALFLRRTDKRAPAE